MYQAASSTLQGATSADVHTGLGHPGQGQTSSELHDNSKKGQGVTGLSNSQSVPDNDGARSLKDDPRHAAQRNLGDVPTGQRGNTGGPSAEEQEPVRLT